MPFCGTYQRTLKCQTLNASSVKMKCHLSEPEYFGIANEFVLKRLQSLSVVKYKLAISEFSFQVRRFWTGIIIFMLSCK